MATEAHCAFCFETLAASLEDREALSLSQVEALWNKYNADPFDSEVPTPASAGGEEASDAEDAEDAEDVAVLSPSDPSYRPAPISRLLANTPSSASSSSVQSTASSARGSEASSEASSATSKSSSRSSLFSYSRRLRTDKTEAASASGEYPLFVTYNIIQKNGDKRLRGCIGTFEPHDLDQGLSSYALTSAFDDTRFQPITTRELPTLECGVTLLTDFETVSDPMDWIIGTHGLRISFTYHNKRYGATYLPDVAKEQGWTKDETLISLMRKAGWSGRKEDWKKITLNVVRYQGSKAKLGYREFLEWREWVEETEKA